MSTEFPDARLTASDAADATVFVDTNEADLITILAEFLTYNKSTSVIADNAIVRGDGGVRNTQDSGVLIDDSDNITGVNELTISNGANDDLPLFNTFGNFISTGLQNGSGLLTINADATKFDISDGVGYIVNNYTDEATPVPTRVAFSGLTAIASTFVATDNVSFIAINSSGTVIQQTTDFTGDEHRTLLVLGTLVHVGSTITSVSDGSKFFGSSGLSDDMAHAIGDINLNGNNFNPASTDLTLRKEAGNSFSPNTNRATSGSNPNFRTSSTEASATFFYVYDDGSGGITAVASQTDIDPDQYDDGSGTLQAVSNNNWTNQLCYFFPASGVMIVRYGRAEYSTQSGAEAGAFEVPPIIGSGLDGEFVRTVISVKKGATDLSDSDYTFQDTGKFGIGGNIGGGGSGGVIQDMQDVYDNSTTPEIITDATRGAVTIQRGSAADTDDVFEVNNGAASQVAAITGEGDLSLAGDIVTVGNVDGRDVSADGDKLDLIEAEADVTDTDNVRSSGALMDDELTSIADVKALNQSVVSGSSPTLDGTNFTGIPTTGLDDEAVTNAKLAHVATATIKGRTTAGTGDVEDLTATQARAVLNVKESVWIGSFAFSNGASAIPTSTPSDAGKAIDGAWTIERIKWVSKRGDTGAITVQLQKSTPTADVQGAYSTLDSVTQLAGKDMITKGSLSLSVADDDNLIANVSANTGSITAGTLSIYGKPA